MGVGPLPAPSRTHRSSPGLCLWVGCPWLSAIAAASRPAAGPPELLRRANQVIELVEKALHTDARQRGFCDDLRHRRDVFGVSRTRWQIAACAPRVDLVQGQESCPNPFVIGDARWVSRV